jgi:hypothetical protein
VFGSFNVMLAGSNDLEINNELEDFLPSLLESNGPGLRGTWVKSLGVAIDADAAVRKRVQPKVATLEPVRVPRIGRYD